MRKELSPMYEYIEKYLPSEQGSKAQARALSAELGLEGISVSATEAHLIQFLLKLINPSKIVEIGTLTGLSALYMLEALDARPKTESLLNPQPTNAVNESAKLASVASKPAKLASVASKPAKLASTVSKPTKLWTFEKSPLHAEKASEVLKGYIEKGQCEIVIGDAQEKLPTIENEGPFDAVFIDGNKAAYLNYWEWTKKNLAPKAIVVIDNVFLSGSVWGDLTKQKFSEKQVMVMKNMTASIFEDKNFISTFIPTEEGLIVAVRM